MATGTPLCSLIQAAARQSARTTSGTVLVNTQMFVFRAGRVLQVRCPSWGLLSSEHTSSFDSDTLTSPGTPQLANTPPRIHETRFVLVVFPAFHHALG